MYEWAIEFGMVACARGGYCSYPVSVDTPLAQMALKLS
jgi:hypothetical protein